MLDEDNDENLDASIILDKPSYQLPYLAKAVLTSSKHNDTSTHIRKLLYVGFFTDYTLGYVNIHFRVVTVNSL